MPDSNLLMIHQGALGDFILTFPAVIRLRGYYPSIDVLCQNQLGKLAGALGLAENCYPLESACWASLFNDRIDPKIKTLLAKYGKIILFSISGQLEASIERITGKPICRIPPRPPVDERIHVARFVLDNICNCGLIKKAETKLDDIPLPFGRGGPRHSRKILLHPGAGSVRKRWPVSNFLQVEAALKADGLEPEFVLGPAEENLANELQHSNRLVHVLHDLQDLTALLKSAGGYIGNDSGASHLAAYIGLPTTVIFGPADPQRWTPIGRAVRIVRPELPCRPCFETDDVNCNDPQCLEGIRPQEVLEAFYKVYQT
ncbi:MAG: glycosyltransferase family 9 protein [Desulfobacterales bacterium]|nr:MAG: glycosyltransferase family 9 protein [Desulfobacterales bacterium]